MKVSYAMIAIAAVILTAEGAPQPQSFWDSLKEAWDFTRGAVRGSGDMMDAYRDMGNAKWDNSDKYFHSRGNYEAAKHGPGGAWVAGVINDAREWTDQIQGDDSALRAANQEAKEWGRGGGDPNKYRPEGLPKEY